MEKLTKKQLKGIAESLGSYYCGGNVYNHENITYTIQHDYKQLNNYPGKNNYEIMEHIGEVTKGIEKFNIIATQIAYSCGVYGNTGQLVKYQIYDINGILDVFYTHYC